MVKPHWFAKWLSESSRPKWQSRIYVGIIVAVIIGLTIFSFLAFFMVLLGTKTAFEAIKLAIGSFLIVGMTWMKIAPLVNLRETRIALAPGWMQSEEEHFLLEWRSGAKDPSHRAGVVRYTAVCPICQGRVRVRGGGFRLPGRLMGRCENSPREHVFTFDHITRRGGHLTR